MHGVGFAGFEVSPTPCRGSRLPESADDEGDVACRFIRVVEAHLALGEAVRTSAAGDRDRAAVTGGLFESLNRDLAAGERQRPGEFHLGRAVAGDGGSEDVHRVVADYLA